MIPIPPSLAMADAIADSVTVSMLAEINGMLSEIFFDSFVFRSVCDLVVMFEYFGTRRTSSKVNPSLISK